MHKNVRITVLAVLLIIAVGVLLSVGQPTVDERDANEAMESAYRAGEFKTAFHLADRYARQGNTRAQTMLGTLYRKGEGVAADPMKASEWYGLAAAQGDAYAQNMLGEMFLRGGRPRRSYGEATELFRRAALKGLDQAKRNLCDVYFRELDTSIDYGNAVKRLHVEAQMANSLAPYEMARMYVDGTLAGDYREAARWFRFAAEQGMPQAQVELGELYFQGLGVPQDYIMAHKWFNVATALLSNIYVHGEQSYALRRRDAVAAKMTPSQIADAQALARDWKPAPWDTLMGRQITPTE